MIPAYNCLPFLTETLISVLQQNIPENKMEIEVVDDASTDGDVSGLVNRIGKGRIKYFRQLKNVGSLRNFETCINRSRGKYIHLLHGDDKVRNGYYDEIDRLFERFPQAGAAFCRFINVDEKGNKIDGQPVEQALSGVLSDWFLKIATYQRIQYTAITVKREVYEKLGSFYGLEYGEDWLMWVRIAKEYHMAYTPEILAEYRKHQFSISGLRFMRARYVDDLENAMALIQHELPEEKRRKILASSRRFYAHYALKTAEQLWKNFGTKEGVKNNIFRSLQLHKDIPIFYRIAKLYIKMFFRIMK
jgi:glycosyltransferase involved in cell wall biosynthesis